MPWDSGRTGTSVHMTREEGTGTDEGLMGEKSGKSRRSGERKTEQRDRRRKWDKGKTERENNYHHPRVKMKNSSLEMEQIDK